MVPDTTRDPIAVHRRCPPWPIISVPSSTPWACSPSPPVFASASPPTDKDRPVTTVVQPPPDTDRKADGSVNLIVNPPPNQDREADLVVANPDVGRVDVDMTVFTAPGC
jgi:hypothetical protein